MMNSNRDERNVIFRPDEVRYDSNGRNLQLVGFAPPRQSTDTNEEEYAVDEKEDSNIEQNSNNEIESDNEEETDDRNNNYPRDESQQRNRDSSNNSDSVNNLDSNTQQDSANQRNSNFLDSNNNNEYDENQIDSTPSETNRGRDYKINNDVSPNAHDSSSTEDEDEEEDGNENNGDVIPRSSGIDDERGTDDERPSVTGSVNDNTQSSEVIQEKNSNEQSNVSAEEYKEYEKESEEGSSSTAEEENTDQSDESSSPDRSHSTHQDSPEDAGENGGNANEIDNDATIVPAGPKEPLIKPVSRPILRPSFSKPSKNSKHYLPSSTVPARAPAIAGPDNVQPLHHWVIIGLVLSTLLALLYRYCCRRSSYDIERGQYRQVAAYYTASAFDDTFDDDVSYEDLDTDYQQDFATNNNNNKYAGSNGSNGFASSSSDKKGRGVIEMKELENDLNEKNGGLSLEEMNG